MTVQMDHIQTKRKSGGENIFVQAVLKMFNHHIKHITTFSGRILIKVSFKKEMLFISAVKDQKGFVCLKNHHSH